MTTLKILLGLSCLQFQQYFHVMPDSNKAIAIALEKALGYAQTGAGFVSYQSLAKQIDSDNLFGVNGDEDNEAPKKIK